MNAESASCLDGKKGKEYIGVRNELLTPHRDTGNKLIPVLTAWGDLTASQAYSTLLISKITVPPSVYPTGSGH